MKIFKGRPLYTKGCALKVSTSPASALGSVVFDDFLNTTCHLTLPHFRGKVAPGFKSQPVELVQASLDLTMCLMDTPVSVQYLKQRNTRCFAWKSQRPIN